MKKQNSQIRTNFFKKIFIKICRIFGYEIIDQSYFYVPTQEKKLDETLSKWMQNVEQIDDILIIGFKA